MIIKLFRHFKSIDSYEIHHLIYLYFSGIHLINIFLPIARRNETPLLLHSGPKRQFILPHHVFKAF